MSGGRRSARDRALVYSGGGGRERQDVTADGRTDGAELRAIAAP